MHPNSLVPVRPVRMRRERSGDSLDKASDCDALPRNDPVRALDLANGPYEFPDLRECPELPLRLREVYVCFRVSHAFTVPTVADIPLPFGDFAGTGRRRSP
jgi:hypothetical protein